MQKIWICGCDGQIGKAINHVVNKLEFEILDTDKDDLDVTNNEEVLRFGEMNRPDVIINCSGMTNTDACEKDKRQAFLVNAMGARNLSIIASKVNAKMVQISTDDVFDGLEQKAYSEFDMTNPQTVYGKTKLAGENYVKEFTHKHFIIRSTWVYGYGDNFVTGFLKNAKAGDDLMIAEDHYGSPTNANDLAHFILKLDVTIQKVPHEQSDFSSVRPVNAVLNNFILSLTDIYDFPEWKDSLKKYLKEIGEMA